MIDLHNLKISHRVRHGTRFGYITGWNDDGVLVSFDGRPAVTVEPEELVAVKEEEILTGCEYEN